MEYVNKIAISKLKGGKVISPNAGEKQSKKLFVNMRFVHQRRLEHNVR